MNPLVSIILPVYKVEEYIEKNARSIFEQTYDNIEIIYVNDGTPDGSIDIIQRTLKDYPSMQSKTTILDLGENKGVATARYTGFNHSRGEYIIHIDSDDYAEPAYIEELVKIAEETGADMVVADYYKHIGNKTNVISAKPEPNPHKYSTSIIVGQARGYLWNKLIRRSLYTNNNINFIPELDIREDKAVIFRLAYFANKIEHLQKKLFHYHFHKGSITDTILTVTKEKSIKCQDDDIKLIELMKSFAKEQNNDPELIDAIQRFVVRDYCFMALTGNIQYYEERERERERERASHYYDIMESDIKNASLPYMHKVAGILLRNRRYFTLRLLRIVRTIKVATLRKIDQI